MLSLHIESKRLDIGIAAYPGNGKIALTVARGDDGEKTLRTYKGLQLTIAEDMDALMATDHFQGDRPYDQTVLPTGASIETLRALAHNITFTVSRTRQLPRRPEDHDSNQLPRPDFGRGYAMEYFLSLRRHGNPHSKQRAIREMKTNTEKWAGCDETSTLCDQETTKLEKVIQDSESVKRQKIENEEKSHITLNSIEKIDHPPPPAYQETVFEDTRKISTTSHRPRSSYRPKTKHLKFEILKTVTVEVQSYENNDSNKSSSASSCSFVTLIWATTLKSHWQCQYTTRDLKNVSEIRASNEEPVELPAEPVRMSVENDSKSVISFDSGWKAPTEWDANAGSLIWTNVIEESRKI